MYSKNVKLSKLPPRTSNSHHEPPTSRTNGSSSTGNSTGQIGSGESDSERRLLGLGKAKHDDEEEEEEEEEDLGTAPVVDSRLSDGDWNATTGVKIHHSSNHRDSYDDDDDPDITMDDESRASLLKKTADHDGRPTRYNHSRPTSPPHTNPHTNTYPTRPPLASRRSSNFRSRSPGPEDPDTQAAAKAAARRKYLYAAFFLVVSLVSFSVQTELAAYVQTHLGWNKAYCMLYLTHGSWALLWPAQLLILRLQSWNTPWPVFWRRHLHILRSTAHMVMTREGPDGPDHSHHHPHHHHGHHDQPQHEQAHKTFFYFVRTTAIVTSALTIAGLSWYLAVNMTSPGDLTAIYNCSAFFAYAFSVPLLGERPRLDKSLAVLVAIAGVLVVAYGDSKGQGQGDDPQSPPSEEEADPAYRDPATRFLGNVIIGVGSVLYGLYEVLYKRLACPPEGVSAHRGTIFANTFASLIGVFTLLVLWIPLPVLHVLGWETFELPTGATGAWLWLSVVMNATFAGSFLVLISLTSPVLSSVAALLTIFIVAVADWLLFGQALTTAALAGGCMIVVAFLVLSWSTWREMKEDAAARQEAAERADWSSSDDESDKDDDRLG